MGNVSKGMIAGLAATIVLSMIMIAKGMMGLMPELNVIAMLSTMMNAKPVVGWAAHFMIGIIGWGVGFAAVFKLLPGGSSVTKGIGFAVAAWLMMMLIVMPLAGAGLFGLNLGMVAPVMTLMLHAIFGVVLGFVFGRLGGAPATVTAE